MALIEIKNLTKQYVQGGQTITPLENLELEIEAHEFVSLIGSSGTGKTTLLNLIAGIDRPQAGSLKVNGVEITKLSRTQLTVWRTPNVGYIFQTHHLIPILTAYENIELPLLLLPMNRKERHQRIQTALQAVDLLDRSSHYPRQLSGGQAQRIGIARAIVTDPKIVVADEPTGDLDPETSTQILQLLKDLNQLLGTTFLMVTHDLAAAQMTGRCLELHKGRLITKSLTQDSPGNST